MFWCQRTRSLIVFVTVLLVLLVLSCVCVFVIFIILVIFVKLWYVGLLKSALAHLYRHISVRKCKRVATIPQN